MILNVRGALLAWALAVVLAAPARCEDTRFRVDQPYSAERTRPVTYDAELVVTITAPYKTKRLQVWLPIPPSDHGQQLLDSQLSTFPEDVTPVVESEPTFGNRFAYFEFTNPQGAQIIRHKFRIQVWELRWNIEPEKVQAVTDWSAEFAPFLRSESQAVVIDDRMKSLLGEIVPDRSNPLRNLQAVLEWTHGNLEYDHRHASLRASSLHAFEARRGHCSDYHGFCAAMGRIMSVPTRVTYGINTFPKASPSHCKLEAFLPPYGWVSFDVSETQKFAEKLQEAPEISAADKDALVSAIRRRLTSGFRDNTWFLQTKGTDYELCPPASQRVPVVRTIYAEADGKPLPDPDPSSTDQTTFAWMTAQRFEPNTPTAYAFDDVTTLREWIREE
jgi:transglutaminase-like putative cysteine protease